MARSKRKGKVILQNLINNVRVDKDKNGKFRDNYIILHKPAIVYVNFDIRGKLIIKSIELEYQKCNN